MIGSCRESAVLTRCDKDRRGHLPWQAAAELCHGHTAPRLCCALHCAGFRSPVPTRLQAGVGMRSRARQCPGPAAAAVPCRPGSSCPIDLSKEPGWGWEQLGRLYPQLPEQHIANRVRLQPAALPGSDSSAPKGTGVGCASDAARGTDGLIGHSSSLPGAPAPPHHGRDAPGIFISTPKLYCSPQA